MAPRHKGKGVLNKTSSDTPKTRQLRHKNIVSTKTSVKVVSNSSRMVGKSKIAIDSCHLEQNKKSNKRSSTINASANEIKSKRRRVAARSLSYSNDVVSIDEEKTKNDDSGESQLSDDQEYEVEKILDEDKDGNVEIKWVGYTKTSWEPLTSIPKHFYNTFKMASGVAESFSSAKVGSKLNQVVSEGFNNITAKESQHPSNAVSETFSTSSVARSTTINDTSHGENAVTICVLCNDEDKSGRVCASCGKSVHHMCSNALVAEQNLEEVYDACFCSVLCYETCQRGPSQTDAVNRISLNKKSTRLCAVCDEEERNGRLCVICNRPVHSHCSNEILDEHNDKSRDASFCSSECYKQKVISKEKQGLSKRQAKPKASKPPRASKKTPQATIKSKKSNDGAVSMVSEHHDELELVVGHNIAFSPLNEDWMSSAVYGGIGSLFLVGIVTRQSKTPKGVLIPDKYEIAWSASEFQGSKVKPIISHAKACEGKQNYDRMMGGHLKPTSWNRLCMPLEESINIDADWDEFDELDESLVRFETNPSLPIDLDEVEKMNSMDFRTEAQIPAPDNLYSHDDGETSTRLAAEHRSLFEHSAASAFLAFLPLAFWRKVVENTNKYAFAAKQPLVTLDEMMKFLGILFYISTVDKGEYSNYWGDQIENKMFGEVSSGLDRVMTLRRFKFIRKNLSFREGVTVDELKSDPAARIRPIIKILRARAPKFVQLGRNVAVDESSVACRSKFGRHMIVYNATKPTGKYHFKIYMMCCSETWFAVSFKLHCASDLEPRLAGVVHDQEIESFREATKTLKVIRKHVLEVVMPVYYTYRVVNTDNFYTSVQLLEALRVVGLYGRGTIRSDSKYSPKFLMMKKKDNVERGTIRQGVDVNHKMVGASWCDGSIVNILSTADASTTSTVDRMIGRSKITFPAPTCIREYNQYMQGVDRIDQLRSRFSIADGHTFKKWHKKLGMAYIDIARCNAFIARKLAGAYATARDPHRTFMIELSSQLIHGDWQSAIGDTGMMYSDPIPNATSLPSPVARSPCPPSPASISSQCTMKHSSDVFPYQRDKRGCVICRFEGRYASQQSVYCHLHKVPLCLKRRVCRSVKSYMCPNIQMTCWDKYHKFYFPSGLFNINGNICRTSTLYKDMKRQKAQDRIPPTIGEYEESINFDAPDTPRSNGYQHSIINHSENYSPSEISSEEFQCYQSDLSFSDQSSIDLGERPTSVVTIDQANLQQSVAQITPGGERPTSVVTIDQANLQQSVAQITPGCIVQL